MSGKQGRTGTQGLHRRSVLGMLGASAGAIGVGLPTRWATAQEGDMVVAHGYSFFGELKYPKDFPHFDYVNPDAPKGGEISVSTRGSFDGMNRFASKGRSGQYSGVIGEALFGEMPWSGGGVPADSLTEQYGLLAHTVEYPKTKEWAVFHMRPEARFADGSPVTAKDVVFTHNLFLEQGIRSYARSVKERIEGAEVIDDHTVKFSFVDGISRRSLISQVGGTPVFSEDWYARTGERLDEPSLLTPMGSGPYVVDEFEINRFIVYKRNPDYWGYHLPINKGRFNFDKIRVEYFADDSAEFEAFKAGVYTFRAEGSTKRWATGYDIPAVEKGDIKLETIKDGTPPTPTGLTFNLLREQFADRRVREAIGLAYNFEWSNASLQFGLLKQRNSFSENTEIEAFGLPEGDEKAFLESLGDVVPPEMFTEEAVRAHTSTVDQLEDRKNKRKALRLFKAAGWDIDDDGMLKNADGATLDIEFLISSSTSDTGEAIFTNYITNLQSFGVNAKLEKTDSAQYAQRYYDKDFDMLYAGYGVLLTVGTGLKQRYGSETAVVSSYNPASLQSPMVDAIIEKSLEAKSRQEEVTALKALDRALRHIRMMVPVWYNDETWVAAYDMYEHPENLPPYATGVLDFWWFNDDKYQALKASGALR